MSTFNWESGEESWGTLQLNGITVPGIAKVDAKLADPRDKQKANGSKRARTRNKGTGCPGFKVTITMNPVHVDPFKRDIFPLLYNASKSSVNGALRVSHPLATWWAVEKVTIGEINMPSPEPGGFMVISFDMDEWVPEPAKAKTTAPKPAAATSQKVAPPQTLEERAKQLAALAFGGS